LTAADTRVPVTVLTGLPGGGKTTLLNRLLRAPGYERTAVVLNEFGEAQVDQAGSVTAQGQVAIIEGACACCSASGGVADALRDLFMAALRRQAPAFRHVLVEAAGLDAPPAMRFMLRHNPFLAERYVYRGAIAVADARRLPEQLRGQAGDARRYAQADLMALSHADLCETPEIAAALEAAGRVCALISDDARPCVLSAADQPLPEAVRNLNPAGVARKAQFFIAGADNGVY
jgi:G3E family GTPase